MSKSQRAEIDTTVLVGINKLWFLFLYIYIIEGALHN